MAGAYFLEHDIESCFGYGVISSIGERCHHLGASGAGYFQAEGLYGNGYCAYQR
jgi:hypothetical protein